MIRLALAALLAAGPAFSECSPRPEQVRMLSERWGESRIAMALDPRGILEIFANVRTETWTVAITGPDGVMCLIASGMYWTDAPGATGLEGEPS